jgi:signal transduction histidine kinase
MHRRGRSLAASHDHSSIELAPGEHILYRITQEALTNVVRHAKATHVLVIVQQAAHQIACSIRDDGMGFDAEAIAARKGSRGLGLREIRERVTAFRWRSSPGLQHASRHRSDRGDSVAALRGSVWV